MTETPNQAITETTAQGQTITHVPGRPGTVTTGRPDTPYVLAERTADQIFGCIPGANDDKEN